MNKQGMPLTPKIMQECNKRWKLKHKEYHAEQTILYFLKNSFRPGMTYFGVEGEVLRCLLSKFLPSFGIIPPNKNFEDFDTVFFPHLTDSKKNSEMIAKTGHIIKKHDKVFVYPLIFWSYKDCKKYLNYLNNPKIKDIGQVD